MKDSPKVTSNLMGQRRARPKADRSFAVLVMLTYWKDCKIEDCKSIRARFSGIRTKKG